AAARECHYRRPDGSPLDFRVAVTRIAFGSREVLCAIVQDVTDHVRAQAALKHSEERYALAVRGANDGLWDSDLKSGQVHLSPRVSEILGFDCQVTSHVDVWLNRLHADDRDPFNMALHEHLNGGNREFQHEHRIQHADGSYRWMLCRGVAVRDAHGKPS